MQEKFSLQMSTQSGHSQKDRITYPESREMCGIYENECLPFLGELSENKLKMNRVTPPKGRWVPLEIQVASSIARADGSTSRDAIFKNMLAYKEVFLTS